ncbi:MAG: hypothetical protein JXQ29_05825 [Planctomycetes bacterium]|nr:hypothetical protein [Planctomycetota bacterium]
MRRWPGIRGLPRGVLGTAPGAAGPFRRLVWMGMALLAVHGALAIRLVQIQVVDHENLLAMAERQQLRRYSVPHHRGNIHDRHGEPLVLSYRGWDLCVRVDTPPDPVVPTRGGRAAILARALGRSAVAVQAGMAKHARDGAIWWQVASNLEHPGIVDLARRHPGWMSLSPAVVRKQPRFPLANELLGRYGKPASPGDPARSMTGLERCLDALLSGEDARLEDVRDGRGRGLALDRESRVIRSGRRGTDVWLTLDSEVQELAEHVLDEIMREHAPVPGAGAVVLEATTGEVLALASRPTAAGPRDWPFRGKGGLDSLPWMLPITYRAAPGSTFKPFTVGEALSGASPVRLEDRVDCGHPVGTYGSLRVGGRFVKNYKERRHGSVTVEEALYRSYNVGMARLAEAMGPERMVGLLERLGFRRDGGGFSLELPGLWQCLGRCAGATSLPAQWQPRITHISWSFGQEMQLSLLDLAAAYTALATDGRLRPPRLVKCVADANGNAPAAGAIEPLAERVVFPPAVAARLRAVLARVVEGEEGTLHRLQRDRPELFGGWRMAAKTGTATEENPAIKAALEQPRWRGHSANVLSLVVMGPIGAEPARYVVALLAPHPRARDLRYISAGQVLGPYGVQILRFLLDRDVHRPAVRDGRMASLAQSGP